MAHRKNIEYWLEKDVAHWGSNVEFYMVDSDCANFAWHLVHQNNIYEIIYSDVGQLMVSEFPNKCWPASTIREIYDGNSSEQSYRDMIGILADTFSNMHS